MQIERINADVINWGRGRKKSSKYQSLYNEVSNLGVGEAISFTKVNNFMAQNIKNYLKANGQKIKLRFKQNPIERLTYVKRVG